MRHGCFLTWRSSQYALVLLGEGRWVTGLVRQLYLPRCEVACLFLGTLVLDGVTTRDGQALNFSTLCCVRLCRKCCPGWRFLIYLTRWSFLLETLYILLAVYVTVQARAASKRQSTGDDGSSFRELYKLPKSESCTASVKLRALASSGQGCHILTWQLRCRQWRCFGT